MMKSFDNYEGIRDEIQDLIFSVFGDIVNYQFGQAYYEFLDHQRDDSFLYDEDHWK